MTLTENVAYTNDNYAVVMLDTEGLDDKDTLSAQWAVVNIKWNTIEQAAYTLFQAIEVANSLSENLNALTKDNPTPLTVVN